MKIRELVMNYFNSEDYLPQSKKELLRTFKINKKDKRMFEKLLKSLEKDKKIICSNNKYYTYNSSRIITGKYEANKRGFGFVIGEDFDVFIRFENSMYAMDSDEVCAVITDKKPDCNYEGKIIKILNRATKRVVGTYQDNDSFGFITCDDVKIVYDVFVNKSASKGAKHGDKVVAEIIKYPDKNKNPEGRVVEIIGKIDDPGIDITSIIKSYELREYFPNRVKDELEEINYDIDSEEIARRVDYRDLLTITIDGVDSKDLDDAISVVKDDDKYTLYVHIADVAHYVRERTYLDKEAYLRGNSYYLLDRVLPMLPKELSNGICSLNPNEDRLTLSVRMDIDKNGEVLSHKISEAIINSDHRLNYPQVSDFLEGKKKAEELGLEGLEDTLKNMEELMHILNEKRNKRGNIDFDIVETKVVLDEKGKVIDIRPDERRVANKIIEEFMIAANETVAKDYFMKDIPFVYRVHEKPKREKMFYLSEFLKRFELYINPDNVTSADIANVLNELKGKKESELISNIILRTMQKARYTYEELGHFGLASKYYSHFTSPIRRYSDLIIHRIIKDFMNGRLKESKIVYYEKNLDQITKHISETELVQEKAERDIVQMKCAEYMQDKIGNVYVGKVSSLTSFGVYVMLENTIEGLCHFSNMDDDFYYFDETEYKVIGKDSLNEYKIGMKVRVAVLDASKETRTIDFKILGVVE